MKVTTSIVASLLACVAVGRPRAKEDGDPLPQKSRITAFVVDENGSPSIECWEISHMLDSMQVQRRDGSRATSYVLPVAGSSELEGLDILTWPSYSPIWPPAEGTVRTEWFDLANTFNLFTIQGGLINFNANFRLGSRGDEEDIEQHVFSLENGDDWFYFEDNYSGSDLALRAHAEPFPFNIGTISSTETEVLRLKFNSQPKHKVVHKGGCSFTGIETPAESSSYAAGTSRKHSPLNVQIHIDESL